MPPSLSRSMRSAGRWMSSNRFAYAPVGRIRLSVPTEAADFLVGPVLPIFLERYPDVEIEYFGQIT